MLISTRVTGRFGMGRSLNTEVQTFNWIQTRAVSDRILVKALSNELDIGEAEAIALAVEIQADQVLIDERRGRLIASRMNLRYIGILGILVEAKSQDLIVEVKPLSEKGGCS